MTHYCDVLECWNYLPCANHLIPLEDEVVKEQTYMLLTCDVAPLYPGQPHHVTQWLITTYMIAKSPLAHLLDSAITNHFMRINTALCLWDRELIYQWIKKLDEKDDVICVFSSRDMNKKITLCPRVVSFVNVSYYEYIPNCSRF